MKYWNCALCALMIVVSAGCGYGIDTGESTAKEMEFTERNQQRLVDAVPPEELKDSLERRNLNKYNMYWNDPDRLSYIYLMSRSGTVISHFVIKGKVTFCGSRITTREQVIEVGSNAASAGRTRHVVESPGLDGSYGPSEDAIFFFTAENPDVPVVWQGDYLVSGVPMNLQTQPVLIRNVND